MGVICMLTAGEIAKKVNDSGLSLENARKEGLLPMNVKAARRILKEGGYDYDRTTKQWAVSVTVPTTKEQATPAKLLPMPTVFLNDDELKALKQLAQQVLRSNMNVTAITYDNPDIELYERTHTLEKGDTTRKTYVIDNQIANRFDSLSERSNIDRSQLLSLALTDFLDKYNG